MPLLRQACDTGPGSAGPGGELVGYSEQRCEGGGSKGGLGLSGGRGAYVRWQGITKVRPKQPVPTQLPAGHSSINEVPSSATARAAAASAATAAASRSTPPSWAAHVTSSMPCIARSFREPAGLAVRSKRIDRACRERASDVVRFERAAQEPARLLPLYSRVKLS